MRTRLPIWLRAFPPSCPNLNGRSVSTDALFETLRLETLDWGVDRGVATEMVSTAEVAVPVSEDQA